MLDQAPPPSFQFKKRRVRGYDLNLHNIYAVKDYVQQTPLGSKIGFGPNSTGMIANEDFIVGLQEGLEAEVGEASAVIMYQCGVEWGKIDMVRFEDRFADEYNMSMRQMNVNFVLEVWWWPLNAAGWGAWRVDLSRVKQGYMLVDVYESALSLIHISEPTRPY